MPANYAPQTTVITKTGTHSHSGIANSGWVQTECGIGYGRRAAGRALPGKPVTCERCLATRGYRLLAENGINV